VFAYQLTHRIVGPFERIIRELDECLNEKRKGPLKLRKNDALWPMVEKINSLLEKLNKG